MRMRLRNITKDIALTDTSIYNNCHKITPEDRQDLLKLNAFLYEINFLVLEKYWKFRTRKIRKSNGEVIPHKMHILANELKEDIFWKQLHQVENFLHTEEQNLKYMDMSSGDMSMCFDCRNSFKTFTKKGGHPVNKINEEGCRRDVEMGLCPNIKGRVLWPEEFMS